MSNNANCTKTNRKLVIPTCLLLFLVLLAIPVVAQHMSQSTAGLKEQLADDTLIILTASDVRKSDVQQTLIEHNCTELWDAYVKKGRYWLIGVKPEPGKLIETENRILATADRNIRAVRRNYLDHFQQCPPDDPEFPGQWALTTQRFTQALCRVRQSTSPKVTLLDSGIYPVQLNNEMNWIQQFKFIVPIIGQPESAFDASSVNHGTGVAGVAAATTNNTANIAGISSASLRVQTTMCRVGSDTVNRQDVYNALAWCSNNQALRGGPGPINLSVNATPPNTFNADPVIQTLAQTLQENGDLVVNGAGNSGLEDPSPERYVRRIAGTDQINLRWTNSVYGPFYAAAPAVSILTYRYPWELAYRTGTSFAAPHWSGAIALLISLNPGRLNALAADSIIYRTATVTPQNHRILNLEAAVKCLKFIYQPVSAVATPAEPIRP